MKKKIIFILITVVVLLFTMIMLVQAAIQEYEQKKILTGETLASVEEMNKKIEERGSLKEEVVVTLANEYINKITNKQVSTISNEPNKVEYFENGIKSRKEAIVTIGSERTKINANTGEFLSYLCVGLEGKENQKSEEEIREMANNILVQSGLVNPEEYVLYELTEFDETTWSAWFAKEDGGIVNLSDNVKFSFMPMTNEIIVLARGNVSYDNNEVIITVKEAKKIAKEYMEKVSASNMDVQLDIVVPNYYWEENTTDSIYKDITRSRKSYVITFNDESQTKVYIDCTTGEVIGGDCIL